MSRAHTIRPDVERALRPGLSQAQYASAVRELDQSLGLRPGEWRDLLECGVPFDPTARRALFETLEAIGADVVPLLVFDIDRAAEDLGDRVLALRAESLRASLPPDSVHGSPTGLPCLRCGACTLESLAEHPSADWMETDLRCGSCGALHLGYGDETVLARDLVLLDGHTPG